MDKATQERQLRTAQYQQRFQIGLRLAAVLLPMILILAISNHAYTNRLIDNSEGKAVQAIGVVTSIQNNPPSRRDMAPGPIVDIKLSNRSIEIGTYTTVVVGERVRVFYSLGKSGEVYPDHLEPLPAFQ